MTASTSEWKLLLSSPPLPPTVPVSEPVLTVVGGRLVVGRPFALRCHSDSGSLPITYTLHGPRRPAQTREVRWVGEEAVFNTSAVQQSADLLTFLCRAQNNELSAARTSAGQELLDSTEVIGGRGSGTGVRGGVLVHDPSSAGLSG